MAKLMLVEDDNNLREIYEARLRAEGYEIVAARDGEEALVVAKSEKPDLIIADIMMPKISGFEMLDILRNTAELKDAKVIMLTALGQSDDQQRANSLGADRYLVKSQVTLEDIIKVVHELLGDSGDAAAATPAPAAAPEPTATATDAPAEPPAATTIPVSEPPQDEAENPAAGAAADDAPSAAQEEAGVESQIEDFVAGATEDAPQAAAEAAEPAEETAPAPDPADVANDDKLVADAAQALIDSTENNQEDAASGEPKVIQPQEAPAEEEPEAEDKPDSSNVTIAHKKVISPPSDQSQQDINTLLAKEEAKEASSDPAAGTTIKPSEPPAQSGNPADPGSIAL